MIRVENIWFLKHVFGNHIIVGKVATYIGNIGPSRAHWTRQISFKNTLTYTGNHGKSGNQGNTYQYEHHTEQQYLYDLLINSRLITMNKQYICYLYIQQVKILWTKALCCLSVFFFENLLRHVPHLNCFWPPHSNFIWVVKLDLHLYTRLHKLFGQMYSWFVPGK